MERRTLSGAAIRAASHGRTITGYAAVFGQRSEDLGGFTETVKPGTFARAIRTRQDVRALFNHNPESLLGRTRSGTLRLSEDSTGLEFQIDLPDTALGRDVHALIERGDISQCSFGFRTVKDSWNRSRTERELQDVDLLDVSPVTFPAYAQTSVSARSASMDVEREGSYVFRGSLYVPDEQLETDRRRILARIAWMEAHER
jgi:uncharacterized protein